MSFNIVCENKFGYNLPIKNSSMNVFDDKCPTCPNYGKGFCDCGKNKSKQSNEGYGCAAMILAIGISIALIIWVLNRT